MAKVSKSRKKFNEELKDKTQRKISFYVKKVPTDDGLSDNKNVKKAQGMCTSNEFVEQQLPVNQHTCGISLLEEVTEIPPTPEPNIKPSKVSLASKLRRTIGKSKFNVEVNNGDDFQSVISKHSPSSINSFFKENKKPKISTAQTNSENAHSFQTSPCSITNDNSSVVTTMPGLFTKIIPKSKDSRTSTILPAQDEERSDCKKLEWEPLDIGIINFNPHNKPVTPNKKDLVTPKKKSPQFSTRASPKINKSLLRIVTPKKNFNRSLSFNDNSNSITPKKYSIETYFSPTKTDVCTPTKERSSERCKKELLIDDTSPLLNTNSVSRIASIVKSSLKTTSVNSEIPSNDLSIDWGQDLSFDFGDELNIPFEKLSPFKVKDKVPKAKSSKFCIQAINRSHDCVSLSLDSQYDSYIRTCNLKGFWMDTSLCIDDLVTVVADFDSSGFTVIDNENGLFVLNPDLLVSSTAVASTLFCIRKSVLAEKFRGWDVGNEAMFVGNIIHELFQKVSQCEPNSISQLKVYLSKILKSNSYLHELYGLGINMSAAEKHAYPYLPSIYSWVKRYQFVAPSPLCHESKSGFEEILAQVTDVKDIEENIWCTTYGIKGKIDVTVQVTLHKRNVKENKTLPLELKTGKPSFSSEHQGQVILYSLMLSDKLQDPEGGLLLYLSDGPQMKFIEATHNKKRGLVQLRNELAYYFNLLKKKNGIKSSCLPGPITTFKFCEKCPFLLPCSLMENDLKQTNSNQRSNLVKAATQHIQTNHMSYFIKWYDLLQLEYALQCKKDGGNVFWTSSASEKEKLGTCFADMKLTQSVSQIIGDRFSHVFYRDYPALSDVGISAGDTVVVSSISLSKEIGLSMGSISSVTDNEVSVLLDKDLYKRQTHKSELFRIDLNFSASAFSTNFKNLLKLMLNNCDSEKLRKLVIDKVEPTFEKGLKRELAEKLRPFVKLLNTLQQRAILKLLMAKDYLLLHGMPGTGKTSTIVALVRVLVALDMSVLLTSYTHSAVDNILLKLSQFDVKFVRLGQESRIHPEIKKYSSDCQTANMSNVEDLRSFYGSIPVVATTCLGMNHAIFKQRRFDVCIVDEASQILQTACFGPLFSAKVFVLVGDTKQLPPVVNSKEAIQQGLNESLFSHLESPSSIFELNIQYRMNSEIMRLCNELTYYGKLQCGSEEVASATLSLSKLSHLETWCEHVLSEELSRSVVFLNTDNVLSSEIQDSGMVYNITEVNIIAYLAEKFIQAGLDATNLGVTSFYKKQVQLLNEKCKCFNIEVKTVDQFQGRDKSVVMISCVRNNDGPAISEIMQDERRLNVALTRAKQKLVVVGSRTTMNKYKPFLRLIDILRKDQFLEVSPEDLEMISASQLQI